MTTTNADYESGTRQSLDVVLKALADAGVPEPDAAEKNWLKWNRCDGGYVIFRANFRGDWGTLDVRWRESDGGFNGVFAPKSYDFAPWIARDVAVLLGDGPVPRETLRNLGKAAQIDASEAEND